MSEEVFTKLTKIIVKDCSSTIHENGDNQYCHDLKRLFTIAEINNNFHWNHTRKIKNSNNERIKHNEKYIKLILDKYPIQLKNFILVMNIH